MLPAVTESGKEKVNGIQSEEVATLLPCWSSKLGVLAGTVAYCLKHQHLLLPCQLESQLLLVI